MKFVLVQTADLMRPPGNRYLALLGQQRGVVPFPLGPLAHRVGETQGLGKVTEPEHTLQALDALPLHQLSVGALRTQLCDLRFGQRGFATAVGGALHLR